MTRTYYGPEDFARRNPYVLVGTDYDENGPFSSVASSHSSRRAAENAGHGGDDSRVMTRVQARKAGVRGA